TINSPRPFAKTATHHDRTSPPILQLWPPSKRDIYANRGGHKCKIDAGIDNGATASGAAGRQGL
ncbi:hypothetical protein, partial [Virgisporangium ochraceum]|uniref:hypothetical protein n=1 Tax=Virgisporangium ochraceum TaxID=65505 RepID=UPI00194070BC